LNIVEALQEAYPYNEPSTMRGLLLSCALPIEFYDKKWFDKKPPLDHELMWGDWLWWDLVHRGHGRYLNDLMIAWDQDQFFHVLAIWYE